MRIHIFIHHYKMENIAVYLKANKAIDFTPKSRTGKRKLDNAEE